MIPRNIYKVSPSERCLLAVINGAINISTTDKNDFLFEDCHSDFSLIVYPVDRLQTNVNRLTMEVARGQSCWEVMKII